MIEIDLTLASNTCHTIRNEQPAYGNKIGNSNSQEEKHNWQQGTLNTEENEKNAQTHRGQQAMAVTQNQNSNHKGNALFGKG